MSLEEGDEGATFGAGLQQPNFAPGQCFLLARMSYIMVVVCVYCIYIYIYLLHIYYIYIWMVNWNDYNILQSNMGSHAEASSAIRKYFPIFMKYITGGYVGEEEAGTRLFQVLHDPKCTKSGVHLGEVQLGGTADSSRWVYGNETYNRKVEWGSRIHSTEIRNEIAVFDCKTAKPFWNHSFLWCFLQLNAVKAFLVVDIICSSDGPPEVIISWSLALPCISRSLSGTADSKNWFQ